jgi:hypothetical protein
MSSSDLSALVQKWIEQGQNQLDAFSQHVGPTFAHFSSILDTAVKEINERTIETKIQGEASPIYITKITNTGDISNEFPSKEPNQNDVYWVQHIQLVNSLIANRQATIKEVIDIAGDTVKGVINPSENILLPKR